VKLTRAVPGVPAGSVPVVSFVASVLTPLHASSPEKTVRTPGGVPLPVAFSNSA